MKRLHPTPEIQVYTIENGDLIEIKFRDAFEEYCAVLSPTVAEWLSKAIAQEVESGATEK